MGNSMNLNVLTFGLFQGLDVGYPMKGIVSERFDDSLINSDQKLSIFQNDEFSINVTVYDDSLQKVDISTGVLSFVVREMEYDRPGKIMIKKTSGDGIEFVDAVNGVFKIDFGYEDTDNMKTSIQYKYKVELTINGKTLTIMSDYFIVRSS
ncbi:MAG: hypothetical protein HQK96_04075 [Nitrospirae bacterium]|nr:hypothetical protein [Nitrospirota bacterium]